MINPKTSAMRLSSLAVFAGALSLAACGGQTADTPPAQQPPATATPATQGVPITGKTEVIQMIGSADATTFSFSPAAVTIAPGDGLRFDVVSGPPHNVAFDVPSLSEAAKAVLITNMPNQDLGPLASKLFTAVGETLTISFANVPPGTYTVLCTPHIAMGMKLTVTVK